MSDTQAGLIKSLLSVVYPDVRDAAEQDLQTILRMERESLQMQIGYIATQLMIAGDKRTMPEIVEDKGFQMSCAIGRCPGPLNCYGLGRCRYTLSWEDIKDKKPSGFYKPQVLENLAWMRFYRDFLKDRKE